MQLIIIANVGARRENRRFFLNKSVLLSHAVVDVDFSIFLLFHSFIETVYSHNLLSANHLIITI